MWRDGEMIFDVFIMFLGIFYFLLVEVGGVVFVDYVVKLVFY